MLKTMVNDLIGTRENWVAFGIFSLIATVIGVIYFLIGVALAWLSGWPLDVFIIGIPVAILLVQWAHSAWERSR